MKPAWTKKVGMMWAHPKLNLNLIWDSSKTFSKQCSNLVPFGNGRVSFLFPLRVWECTRSFFLLVRRNSRLENRQYQKTTKPKKQFNKHNRHVLRTAVALPEVMKVSCNMLNVPTTWRYLKKTFHVKVCHAYMYNLNIVIGASLSKLIWCFFYSVLLNHKEKPCKAPIIWAWCTRVMSRDYIIGHPLNKCTSVVSHQHPLIRCMVLIQVLPVMKAESNSWIDKLRTSTILNSRLISQWGAKEKRQAKDMSRLTYFQQGFHAQI